jgi:nucleotide-binding universal stress UspA family protein
MKTILVPVDFSPVTRAVVREASALARRERAQVVLLHAIPPPNLIATDAAAFAGPLLELATSAERAARRHLARLGSALEKRAIKVRTYCVQGLPAVEIERLAHHLRPAFVVIGSHGHSAFYDLVLGSTTMAAIKRAHCPVLVVPAHPPTKTGRRR